MTTDDREMQMLEAIKRGQRIKGYAPTRRELAAEIGISTSRVQQLVESCTEKGYLRRVPRTARAFVVEHMPQTSKGAR